ncbi:MAG: LysR family transcriptional regulator [Myxococcota bacterium]
MDVLSLRLFLSVAELSGVSAAARQLSLSPASASARLARLEDELGFRLFTRTTRAVSLTTDGSEFLPYAKEALGTLEAGLGLVRGETSHLQGTIRITMPGSFGRMHVIPLMAEFQEQHPDVKLDLRLSDEVLDVTEGAYDLILRNAPLHDSSIVARKLAEDHRLLVASPAYLERHGAPTAPDDLTRHRCVLLADAHRLRFANGEVITVRGSLNINDGEAMRSLIELGMGIGVSSLWNAGGSLASRTLVQVLPDFPLVTDSAIWALYPSKRLVPPRVRALIDFLVARFSASLPWETEVPSPG